MGWDETIVVRSVLSPERNRRCHGHHVARCNLGHRFLRPPRRSSVSLPSASHSSPTLRSAVEEDVLNRGEIVAGFFFGL